MRAVPRLEMCEPVYGGVSGDVEGVRNSTVFRDVNEAVAFVLDSAEMMAATPVKPRVVFDFELLRFRSW